MCAWVAKSSMVGFTVKVMHPDATAAHAATLARPIIQGLLGQAVTAEETAAAQEAEREHLQDTKSFNANQLGRIFSGWAGWLGDAERWPRRRRAR